MNDVSPRSRSVTVDLPEEAFHFHRRAPDEVATELRLLFLLDQVRQRRLGHAKAAELSGTPRARFLQLMGLHHISPLRLRPGRARGRASVAASARSASSSRPSEPGSSRQLRRSFNRSSHEDSGSRTSSVTESSRKWASSPDSGTTLVTPLNHCVASTSGHDLQPNANDAAAIERLIDTRFMETWGEVLLALAGCRCRAAGRLTSGDDLAYLSG